MDSHPGDGGDKGRPDLASLTRGNGYYTGHLLFSPSSSQASLPPQPTTSSVGRLLVSPLNLQNHERLSLSHCEHQPCLLHLCILGWPE
ncbi:Os11g0259101 [Oryza sativa Japonica Group]|uniref:Os11g0259101 protein n=1 Tax=Oryza sativa subsp. japonica TaxID=39947 RepID=A0A0P0Y0Z5_ORYSJ|nr:Os11g0259101 [Oryza sativa Japonica Group]